MAQVLESLQKVSDAQKQYVDRRQEAYSNFYAPVMREQRQHLETIVDRLNASREIVKNVYSKMKSRFDFDLGSIPEFRWFSLRERDLISVDDLKVLNIDKTVFMSHHRLQLFVDTKRTVEYPVHPVFYTGGTQDISKFVRNIFYRENLRLLHLKLNVIKSVKHSRDNCEILEGPANRFKTFDEYYEYINGVSVDEALLMCHYTLVSQLNKNAVKLLNDLNESF